MTATSDSSQSSKEESATAAAGGHRIGRWQFSLRSLMLFVLLAAMGMALFTTGWQLLRARKELEEYRREYGILKVDNPAMLYAVARWTPEPGRWRWQVHFPPGRYDVCYATAGIREDGFPKPLGGLTSDFAGDATVSAAFFKDQKSGKWVCSFQAVVPGISCPVSDAVVNPPASSISGVQWNQEPAIVSPKEALVLLRRQIATRQKDGSITMWPLGATDGLMLWIQRVGEPTGSGSVMW